MLLKQSYVLLSDTWQWQVDCGLFPGFSLLFGMPALPLREQVYSGSQNILLQT